MTSSDLNFSRQDILDLLAEEKEAYSAFERLCARYQVEPHPIAAAVAKARIDLLNRLLQK